MSSRKIIFLVIVGILGLFAIFGLISLLNKQEEIQTNKVESLSIWVVGGTSEDYGKIFAGFNSVSEIYKNTVLNVQVFPNYKNYRDTLITLLSDDKGPDIFMIEGEGDDILASKSVPIPENLIHIGAFEKRYEDIFLPLIGSEGEGKSLVRTLKGVPLGYETLGIFYNKSYFPTVPKTWNEVELLYPESRLFFPTNLGLGPRYTPDATDIIAYFLMKNGTYNTKNLDSGTSGIEEYLDYAKLKRGDDSGGDFEQNESDTEGTEISTSQGDETLASLKKNYDESGYSTIDSFIAGEIGMVIGFPSTIREMEKAQKRAGANATTGLILTERIPQNSLGKGRFNLARYKYFAISSKSKNPTASLDFIKYLMDEKTLALSSEVFPYLISPDRSISQSQGQKSLSPIFARAYLDSFIPLTEEKISVFQYGLKNEYENIFEEYIDRNDKININNILTQIQKSISCKMKNSLEGVIGDECLQ